MKFYFDFKHQERRNEESVKYSSLESRFLGDVFKTSLDTDNTLNSYDGKFMFVFCQKILTLPLLPLVEFYSKLLSGIFETIHASFNLVVLKDAFHFIRISEMEFFQIEYLLS